MGTALEDPFGDDITDLPMDKFCHAIEVQVEAIFHDSAPVGRGSDSMIGGRWLREQDVQSHSASSNCLDNVMAGCTK